MENNPTKYPNEKILNEVSLDSEQMERIRQDFYRQEEMNRLDPEKMQIRIVILNTFESNETGKQI